MSAKYSFRLVWTLLLCVPILLVQCQKPNTLRYLALGDSYTIGESVNKGERWPAQLCSLLDAHDGACEVTYVAKTGWRTDDLLNGIEDANLDPSFDMVSVLIGVNNQFQGKPFDQYEKDFPKLLAEAIRLASGDTTKVFVVSIPDYYYTPFGQAHKTTEVSVEIDAYNQYAQEVCDQWNIPFYNITPISRQTEAEVDLVATDGLHPSAEQYKAWVKLISKDPAFQKRFR